MGTIKSSESLALAESLRRQRTSTAAEVDAAAERRGALARYNTRQDRSAPAAH
jgi:hypothetical protein